MDLEDQLPEEEIEDPNGRNGGNESSEAALRGRLVKAAAAMAAAVLLLAVLVLLRGEALQPPVAPAALAREVMDSARGDLVVRQLQRMYAEELELYGVPGARDLVAVRDEFTLECAMAADDSLAEGAAGFDAVEMMERTTQYCEEVARIAFERAGIPTPY